MIPFVNILMRNISENPSIYNGGSIITEGYIILTYSDDVNIAGGIDRNG